MSRSGWSTPADVAARVRRRWDSGALLGAFARAEAFEPVAVPLRGPAAGEVAERLEDVRAWVAALERGSRRRGGPTYRLETRPVGGRLLGSNQLPARAWVESYDAAWRLLDVEDQVAVFAGLLSRTRDRQPALVDWAADHPLRALALAPVWGRLLDAAEWIATHGGKGLYLRQIDVAGVDTKFVEQHRGVLADLVDVLLPEIPTHGAPAVEAPRTDLARRYGFLSRPGYVRLRLGAGAFGEGVLPGLSEATMRVDELAGLEPVARRVFVLENEITYLAFPMPPDSLVVFGAGYTVSLAGSLPWLAEQEVWYWGDLDTHGFAILNRLRHACPQARSFLMDRGTLLAHRDRWVTEPRPTSAHLDQLTPAEGDLYQDLVEGTFGPAVRLEQERVAWPAVEAALGRLSPQGP
jgi:hypothetical protein